MKKPSEGERAATEASMWKSAVGTGLALVVAAGIAGGEPQEYLVDPERCQVAIHVGRGGLFSFAGHEHEILAPRLGGRLEVDAAHVESSTVRLTFETAALRVSGRGEPPEDVPKVQARMIGPELLDIARFPTVTFSSTGVEGKAAGKDTYELRVTGDLELHGVKRSTTVPVRVTTSGGELRASGTLVLRQTDYALKPVSVAGVIKVKDEVSIEFTIVAVPAPQPTLSPQQER